MSRRVSWLAGIALVVAAWFVAFATPAEDAREAPFVVRAEVGQKAEGRDIAARVDGLRRADAVTAARWRAEGNWLIVDLTVSSRVTTSGAFLGNATLHADGRAYYASERPTSLHRQRLYADLPRSGSIAFELPPDLTPGIATLRLGGSTDERLDSVLEITLDIGGIAPGAEEELRTTQWSTW